MPASLNCPSCGAAAAGPDASRCDYCGSTLRSMACPSCFGAMFAGMQFCPHCGAKGDRVVDDGATLSCPGCSGDMKKVRLGATPMFECDACHSTWLDAETFSRLCLDREQRGSIAAKFGSPGAAPAAPQPGGVRYRPCPACKAVMNRENFGKRSGVIIDVCKGHGVWFEPCELHSVMAFIDRGGLEQARAGPRKPEGGKVQDREARMAAFRSSATASSSSSTSMGEKLLNEALSMLFS